MRAFIVSSSLSSHRERAYPTVVRETGPSSTPSSKVGAAKARVASATKERVIFIVKVEFEELRVGKTSR
jgi:hypothetical protein